MDNSNVGAATRTFLRIFSEVTYIRTVGTSTMLKIYTLPNHTITSVYFRDNSLAYYMAAGASFVRKWSVPWMSANIYFLLIVWFLCFTLIFRYTKSIARKKSTSRVSNFFYQIVFGALFNCAWTKGMASVSRKRLSICDVRLCSHSKGNEEQVLGIWSDPPPTP
jgi:hypothetical protein